MKIDKYIGQSGYSSRRKAYDLIGEQRVQVNGKVANYTTKVKEGDIVLIDGKKLVAKTIVPTYIIYNKPKGIICTSEKVAGNIIDAIGHPETIYPVGRLDKDSEGLMLLTNQGALIDKITNPVYEHEKEYIVTVDKPITIDFINKMRNGVRILGTVTQKCFVQQQGPKTFKIILTQGLNRQIRRMCETLDYSVTALKRIRIMHIKLTGLQPGSWRYFTPQELATIQELVANSSKTADGVDGMDE